MRYLALLIVGIACFGIGYSLPGHTETHKTISYIVIDDEGLQQYRSDKNATISFSASINHGLSTTTGDIVSLRVQ